MSDVGLKKWLERLDVTLPSQGYWNRVHAGQTAPVPPTAPDRRPGESGRIRVDQKFAGILPVAPDFPVDGPFESQSVPEDLEQLGAQELVKIGRVTVPKSLESPHPGLTALLRKQKRQQDRYAVTQYRWDRPLLDSPFDQRRLRFVNALFLALTKRGHTGSAGEIDGDLSASATIGDTYVALKLEPALSKGRNQSAGYRRFEEDLPASTPMKLSVGHEAGLSWKDDGDGKVERKLADITASIIAAGEGQFRLRLREEHERKERLRRDEAERYRLHLLALEQKRLEQLKRSGELLREAENIRTLVAQVKQAVLAVQTRVSEEELAAWETWAIGYANRVDPVRSGQIFEHLNPEGQASS